MPVAICFLSSAHFLNTSVVSTARQVTDHHHTQTTLVQTTAKYLANYHSSSSTWKVKANFPKAHICFCYPGQVSQCFYWAKLTALLVFSFLLNVAKWEGKSRQEIFWKTKQEGIQPVASYFFSNTFKPICKGICNTAPPNYWLLRVLVPKTCKILSLF